MSTTPPETPRLSDEEIGETFEKLRLNDPRVREFYQQLAHLEAASEQDVAYWLGTHSHTNISSSEP